MKYKPRNSNFDDLQDDFADEVASACRTYHDSLERLKDLVASTIDSYLDAIIKEHLEERTFSVYGGKEPVIMFCLGENKLPDGTTDLFYTERSLREVLEEIDPRELDEPEHAAKFAEMFEGLAAKYRAREIEIKAEDEEFAAHSKGR